MLFRSSHDLKVMLPDTIDKELSDFIERWGKTHPYDIRSKTGTP